MSAAPVQAKKTPQASAHLTSKQLAASRANLAKARAAQKGKPRTAKQIAASRRNLIAARAAQRTRKQKKQAASKKTAKAPLDGLLGLHSLPACASVAVVSSLQAWTGLAFSATDAWDLYLRAGEGSIEQVLEYVAGTGLGGWRLASFERADPGIVHPWLIYGLQFAHGYHAVLSTLTGVRSWGMEMPRFGEPEEAWMLEWAEVT